MAIPSPSPQPAVEAKDRRPRDSEREQDRSGCPASVPEDRDKQETCHGGGVSDSHNYCKYHDSSTGGN